MFYFNCFILFLTTKSVEMNVILQGLHSFSKKNKSTDVFFWMHNFSMSTTTFFRINIIIVTRDNLKNKVDISPT